MKWVPLETAMENRAGGFPDYCANRLDTAAVEGVVVSVDDLDVALSALAYCVTSEESRWPVENGDREALERLRNVLPPEPPAPF